MSYAWMIEPSASQDRRTLAYSVLAERIEKARNFETTRQLETACASIQWATGWPEFGELTQAVQDKAMVLFVNYRS